eukprot:CAMPEP_0178412500 /NCGR_PEP_ID=MMETSP0689_2-20121128/22047_1 /TAXON_ID=160604 /ORGANISM="Amphidinium massartii, Strain CS-259" /LENGTH=55 /DNA_ID=CAMNT_0020033749 /DNA_START=814 /DNA_END=981 /DNA_ORIENTATION=+
MGGVMLPKAYADGSTVCTVDLLPKGSGPPRSVAVAIGGDAVVPNGDGPIIPYVLG